MHCTGIRFTFSPYDQPFRKEGCDYYAFVGLGLYGKTFLSQLPSSN